MNEPFIRLLIFAAFILLNRLSSRWLWKLLLKEAGISNEELQSEWRSGDRYAQHWFRAQCRKSAKANMIYNIYQFCTLPCMICFPFAVFGLFTHSFDKYYIYVAIFLAVQIIALLVAGFIYRRKTLVKQHLQRPM